MNGDWRTANPITSKTKKRVNALCNVVVYTEGKGRKIMARWAESRDEFEHLRRISEQEHKSTEEGYILGFQLKNGTILSGLVVGSSARNNYGEKGPFKGTYIFNSHGTKAPSVDNLPPILSQLGSDGDISESAYLIERGVRPMSIVGQVKGEGLELLQISSHLEILSINMNVIPFVIPRKDGFVDCGFAAAQWVVDLYEWLVQSDNVPIIHEHRIRGLLLGYSSEAIRDHDERCCGRRFTWLPEKEPKHEACDTSDKGENLIPC